MTARIVVWFRAFVALLGRPGLWWAALRQLWRFARPRWWRRWPFLPLPDRGYLRFRMETAYGARGRPSADDVVAYVAWCATCDRARRRHAAAIRP